MGHSEHEKLRALTATMDARYVGHLEDEVRDLRKLRDELRRDMADMRAELQSPRAVETEVLAWKRRQLLSRLEAEQAKERRPAAAAAAAPRKPTAAPTAKQPMPSASKRPSLAGRRPGAPVASDATSDNRRNVQLLKLLK